MKKINMYNKGLNNFMNMSHFALISDRLISIEYKLRTGINNFSLREMVKKNSSKQVYTSMNLTKAYNVFIENIEDDNKETVGLKLRLTEETLNLSGVKEILLLYNRNKFIVGIFNNAAVDGSYIGNLYTFENGELAMNVDLPDIKPIEDMLTILEDVINSLIPSNNDKIIEELMYISEEINNINSYTSITNVSNPVTDTCVNNIFTNDLTTIVVKTGYERNADKTVTNWLSVSKDEYIAKIYNYNNDTEETLIGLYKGNHQNNVVRFYYKANNKGYIKHEKYGEDFGDDGKYFIEVLQLLYSFLYNKIRYSNGVRIHINEFKSTPSDNNKLKDFDVIVPEKGTISLSLGNTEIDFTRYAIMVNYKIVNQVKISIRSKTIPKLEGYIDHYSEKRKMIDEELRTSFSFSPEDGNGVYFINI